jgi:hypothetical protein
MKRIFLALLPLALAGCATRTASTVPASKPGFSIAAFSSNSAGGLPPEWKPLIILRTKKSTDYQLVADGQRTV